jgi:hypothetical protein
MGVVDAATQTHGLALTGGRVSDNAFRRHLNSPPAD